MAVAATALPFLGRYQELVATERKRAQIRDIQVMVMQGPRTYTLVKVVSDAGVYGIGESYGSPGAGVKETHCFRVWAIGRQSWPHDDCQRTRRPVSGLQQKRSTR